MAEFKIGDVVRVRSGGPSMVITELPTTDKPRMYSFNRYECEWWQTGPETYTSGRFAPAILVRVDHAPGDDQ